MSYILQIKVDMLESKQQINKKQIPKIILKWNIKFFISPNNKQERRFISLSFFVILTSLCVN